MPNSGKHYLASLIDYFGSPTGRFLVATGSALCWGLC